MHKFAQPFPPISIDAANRIHYLPHQIEPGSLKLYGWVSRTQLLHGGCGREISNKNRKTFTFLIKKSGTHFSRSFAPFFFFVRLFFPPLPTISPPLPPAFIY